MQHLWHSYHLHLHSGLNQFLSSYFLPAFEKLMTQEIIKRFFYIRFSEGGMHLRMRFQLDGVSSEPQLEEALRETVNRFLNEIPKEDIEEENVKLGQIVKSPYDRELHYFGETMTTVYAELMNERTSYIALKLLRAYGEDRGKLFLIVLMLLLYILRNVNDTEETVAEMAIRSEEFTLNTLQELNIPVDTVDLDIYYTFDYKRLVHLLEPGKPLQLQFQSEPNIAAVISLIRRWQRYSDEAMLSTHALHLLCNKLGIYLIEEYFLFRNLRRVCL